MPKITHIEFLKRPEQPVLLIRKQIPMDELPEILGPAFIKIGNYISSLGEMPADVPFVCFRNYREMDLENVTVEIGFHLSRPLPPEDDILAETLPACMTVMAMYKGSNHDMLPLYEEMAQKAGERGYRTVNACEYYYNDNVHFSEDDLLTKVVLTLGNK